MVLHSLNIDIRSASFDLGGALEQLYVSNDLRAELPGHAATLTLQVERAGSGHALDVVPIDARSGVFAEHNLSGCPAFYADGRFYARGADGLEIEYDLVAHAVRANVGGRRAGDARMVAIHVVRGILQSFLLPFYGLHAAHGAVVSDGERTVMLTGRGGAGKTTAALYLQHHGFELLSDDAPLFVAAGGEALALSSLDYHHVTPATVELLPWLAEHVIGETDIRGKLAVSQSGLQPGDGWRRPRRVTHVVELHRGPVAAPRL
ncbi:MAG: hypothetical protein JWM73_2160, partial [Solirubrobacterales bacterium]|nr:hypothetical protein [Solirubrobacterales bacterium]